MGYTQKIALNTAAQMIGKVAGIAVALASTAILFRYFGVEGVGEYTTVFAFAGFFSVFADFGLQWTLVRELTVQKDKNKVFRNIFTIRLIFALVIHSLAFASVWFFNYPLQVKLGVGIISLAWFFTTMNSNLVGVFFSRFRVYYGVSMEVLGKLVILAAILFLTRANQPFNVVLAAYLLGNIVNFVGSAIFARRCIKLGFGWDRQYLRHALRQAVPIGIVLIFGFIYFKIDSVMLSLMRGMTDVGIYGSAFKLLEVLQGVPSMFLGAAFPLVTAYVISKDKRMYDAFQKQFDFLVLIDFPLVAGVFVLAAPIISFIAGSRGVEFTTASTVSIMGHPATSITVLRILIVSVGLNFFSNLYSYLIVSLGKQKAMILPMVFFAAFNFIANLIVIPRFSYFGSALTTVATEVAVFATYYFMSRRFVKFPLKFGSFFKIFFSAAAMGFVCWGLNRAGINLFLNISFSVLLYAALVLVLRAVPFEMVKGIVKKA